MKRRVLLGAALASAMAMSMTAGCFAEETAESVLQKYAEASAEVKALNATATIDMDVNLNVQEMNMSLGINVDAEMPMQYQLEPLEGSTNATFKVSAAGEQMDMAVEMYLKSQDDGSVALYTKTASSEDEEAAAWDVQTITSDEVEQLMTFVTGQSVDMTDIPLTFELAPEKAEVNGASCYVLSSQLTWTDLKNIMQWAMGKVEIPEEQKAELDEAMAQLDQLDAFAEGIVVNMSLGIDDTTYYPMAMHMDLEGSDWSVIQQLVPSIMGMENEDGTPMTVEMTVPTSNIDYVYDYETPVSVTVPEEALAAAEAETE